MRDMRVRRLAGAGMLTAVGVLLPQLFHLVGGNAAGGVFLPMHIPVLLGGLLFGPGWGAAVGVVTPVISTLVSGMPPLDRLPFMVGELAVYGAAGGLFYRVCRWPLPVSLLITQAAGRLVYALALLIAGNLLHLGPFSVVGAWTATVSGLPGIAVQWVLVPLLVYAVKKGGLLHDG